MFHIDKQKQEHGGGRRRQQQGGTRQYWHSSAKRTIVVFVILLAVQYTIQHYIEVVTTNISTTRDNVLHNQNHNGREELFHPSSNRHHYLDTDKPPHTLWEEKFVMHEDPNNYNNDTIIYTISNIIRNEYMQWHRLVQKLSQIQLEPNDWTPTIHNWSNHPKLRSHRFPSVSERVQYYMGPWYNASKSISMHGNAFHNDVHIHLMSTRKYGPYSSLLVNLYNLNRDALYYDCYQNKKELRVFSPYCRDYIDVAILHAEGTANVLHFIGDGLPYMNENTRLKYPIFAKVRPICSDIVVEGVYADGGDIDHVMENNMMCKPRKRVDSILLPLNRKRHYGVASSIPVNDIPWEQKTGKAVWRGKYGDISHNASSPNDSMKHALVSKHLNSTVVDAKFSKSTEHTPKEMIGQYMDIKAQLAYKYIISIEGNDVSSGLKWMLFSNSVVFSPPFTMSSWAMEDKLQPFIHYIPIRRDMSNVEDMIHWAESHPDEVKLISERSTLFVYDLLFHPEAMEDEREIMIQMMERYEQNFGYHAEWKRWQSSTGVDWSKHPSDRRERFPSVEERVRYAMGKWYHENDAPSMQRTESNLNSLSHSIHLNDGTISRDKVFLASGDLLSMCAAENSTTLDIRQWCKSSLPYFDERHTADLKSNSFIRLGKSIMGVDVRLANVSSWRKDDKRTKDSKRVLLDDSIKIICFGNCSRAKRRLTIPYFTGYRKRHDKNAILWPFDAVDSNALDMVKSGWNEINDMKFEDKVPRAIARRGFDFPSATDSTTWLDVVNESSHREDHVRNMLSYRYLLATEGDSGVNDDLLWMLKSTSVVLMPAERQVSTWLLEDFLTPNVHFVSVAPDYSDIAKQIQWCENNLDEIKLISERATLFVYDLLMDRKSEKENEEVKVQVMERYARTLGSR